LGDDLKFIHEHTHEHEDEQDEMTISTFTSEFEPSSSKSKLANLLAQAVDISSEISSINSKKVASVTAEPGNNNNVEGSKEKYQALAVLEKELGLADLQLFSHEKSEPTSGTKSSSATKSKEATTETSMEEIDDNLDELEGYLRSLSSAN
jgi:hypothetical protein